MNWELIISIAALVTGGGCIIWIFNAGQWKGEISTKVETIRKDLDSATDGISGKVKSEVGHNSKTITESVSTNVTGLRAEFTEALTRIHQRLDEKSAAQQQTENRLEAMIAGIGHQRQEWDTLRGDIRVLLHSEATTTNEISNFKERLVVYEQKMSASMEKIARLESDVAHINADRKK